MLGDGKDQGTSSKPQAMSALRLPYRGDVEVGNLRGLMSHAASPSAASPGVRMKPRRYKTCGISTGAECTDGTSAYGTLQYHVVGSDGDQTSARFQTAEGLDWDRE